MTGKLNKVVPILEEIKEEEEVDSSKVEDTIQRDLQTKDDLLMTTAVDLQT